MSKDKMLEIIEENSFMKYNICKLIDQLKQLKIDEKDEGCKIYCNDIIDYLEQILGGKNERDKRKYSDFK